MRILIIIVCGLWFLACQESTAPTEESVVNSDIDLFWNVFDLVVQESDTLIQETLIDSLYLSNGSIGLNKMVEVKGYTAKEYVDLINQYPAFWNSIRSNTHRSKDMAQELSAGIEKLRALYPNLKPAQIFFTIGAMRSNGTTRDSLVLIGSELAMADSTTNISEFEGRTKEWLQNFFAGNPIDHLVLLNVHEYVHTQQHPISSELLYQVLYEGIAEFISVIAMGVPSSTPAVAFGKSNPEVARKFEEEMFFERGYEWLWSNAPNDFDVRDLGYYIGYAIAEKYYDQSQDKNLAVKQLIELDYQEQAQVNAVIDSTHFFTKSIEVLREEDRKRRPKVIGIQSFENGDQAVNPNLKEITVAFSTALTGYHTGVDYGNLGEDAFPKVLDRKWSQDNKSWTMQVELEPNKQYQILISNNFRTEEDLPLIPYLIEFKTGP